VGVILLVRHGQASFGGADYDVLAERGERQARRLGAALAARGVRPAALASGSMRRQRDSAAALSAAAGWELEPSVDPGWNEYEHQGLAAVPAAGPGSAPPDPAAFQDALEAGIRRWAADDAPVPANTGAGAGESFAEFTARTEAALRAAAARQSSGATTVVVTSGGVIGWLAATLLGAGVEQWIRLNRVTVNTGVTTLIAGRRGLSLVSFNDHGHLPQPDITYR